MSVPDFLVSHKDSDHYSVSASDLLMSQGAVDSKDTQGSFDIAGKWIIENVEELFNDNTVNLDKTFLYRINDRTDYAGSSLFVAQGQRRAGRRPAYLGDFVGIFDKCILKGKRNARSTF